MDLEMTDNYKTCIYMYTQLLNKLSKKVPVAQVSKIIYSASKTEQPEFPSSFHLEVL